MPVFYWIIMFSLIGSVLSVTAAAAYLLLPNEWRKKTLSVLVSFATGVLLGVAFIHLLPSALDESEKLSADGVMMTVLAGIFVFFVLEKALIWRHAHHHEPGEALILCEVVEKGPRARALEGQLHRDATVEFCRPHVEVEVEHDSRRPEDDGRALGFGLESAAGVGPQPVGVLGRETEALLTPMPLPGRDRERRQQRGDGHGGRPALTRQFAFKTGSR